MKDTLFHLAFPSYDLKATRKFYADGLGCKVGRETEFAIIFDLGGHQIVAQLTKGQPTPQKGIYPRHFGLVFQDLKAWKRLLQRAKRKRLKFFESEKKRFPKSSVEHHTFFLQDPSFNILEFKCYTNPQAVFGERRVKKLGDKR